MSEWIKVSDKLPEPDTTVLIWVLSEYGIGEREIHTAQMDADGWWDCPGCGGYEREVLWNSDTITHWSPLPEAPNE